MPRIAKKDHVSFGSSAQRFGACGSAVPPPGAYEVEAELGPGAENAMGKRGTDLWMNFLEMMVVNPMLKYGLGKRAVFFLCVVRRMVWF